MAHRTPLVPLVLACSVLAGGVALGQGRPREAAGADTRVPRTASGHPDLRGFWTNDNLTPLERPAEFGDRRVLTAGEAVAYTDRRVAGWAGQPQDDIHYDDVIWQREAYEKESLLRTSLIVEPANGQLPPLTPEGERRAAALADARRLAGPADSAEGRSLAERCISWGNVGPPMLPPTYGANLQILQTDDHVVVLQELMDGLRLIPVDGRPHVDAGVRRLAGDSRGHWSGDTLVVETTNFTARTNFRGPPSTTRQDIFASETLRVEERFTLLDADTIRYEFTVEDPTIWTAPWSGELPIRRFEGPIYEFACHEGNYGLANILRGARAAEQASRSYTAPRNAFGQPDLEGRWENNAITPLQRPPEWAGRATLTDGELEQLVAASRSLEESDDALFGDELVLDAIKGQREADSHDTETGNYNAFWLPSRDIDNRTSLIIDPPDGRMPALTPQAQARRRAAAERRRLQPADGPESRGLTERCITFGVPRFGAAYSSVYEIVQSPATAVFRMETIHDARVIPLDGRPHLPGPMEQWMGNSRGHWEGETLVVETEGFTDRGGFIGSSAGHLVERFTRVADDVLQYDATMSDPETWERPWTVRILFRKIDEPLLEYACHEGNVGMFGILSGARHLETEEADGR